MRNQLTRAPALPLKSSEKFCIANEKNSWKPAQISRPVSGSSAPGKKGWFWSRGKASPSGAVRVGEWKRVKAPSKRTMDNLRGNFDIEGNPL